ncbi:MAG: tetratricopeptide repeat protein [Deltaproteobacteria bacterium]|nr:tetratricopeptide repeat protein [Deltaproteobacteria bacterium]
MIARITAGLLLSAAAWAQPASPSPVPALPVVPGIEVQVQVEQAAARLEAAADKLLLVEKQYTQRKDKSTMDVLRARYSEGEIRYLLGDYRAAAVLFYDLVSEQSFQDHPGREDALFYLADSLLQSENLAGGKLHMRQVLEMKGRRYREALLRYVEVAGRTNDFTGIDEYVALARTDKGELSPELAYTYGKWSFRRTDLPPAERLARVRAAFMPLASDEKGYYRLQATYYLAVAHVQEQRYEDAVESFRRITLAETTTQRDARTRELAWLSLGRVYYETGKYAEALDAYQEIPRNSESFIDSLYETAWTRVKEAQYQKAKDATELLVAVAEEHPLAPEAQILNGNLNARMKQYEEAINRYDEVVKRYTPVRDELDGLLAVNKDPVAYYDRLLANSTEGFDAANLLPETARKWATTQQEVSDAVAMVNAVANGRRDVVEAEAIGNRILKALDERGLDTFPELQEGYKRADAVSSSLTETEDMLTRIERELLRDVLSPAQAQQLEALRTEQGRLQPAFDSLPTTEEELTERNRRMQARADEADRFAYRVNAAIQESLAQIKEIQRLRRQKAAGAEPEGDLEAALRTEREGLEEYQKLLEAARMQLATERSMASGSVAADEELRKRYGANLGAQQTLLATASGRAPVTYRPLLSRIGQVRARGLEIKRRVDEAKRQLRAQVQTRGAQIRTKVRAEMELLRGYGGEVARVDGDARQLVGRIAIESFRRVRQQFHDLVLKADVGIVDVAFSRKQDSTQAIQKLSAQKDRELRQLDEEFREVLREVD